MARDHDRRRPAPALVLPGFPGTKVAALGHAGAGSLHPAARADHVHDADPVVSSGSDPALTNSFLGIQPAIQQAITDGVAATPTIRVAVDPTGSWDAANNQWITPRDGLYMVRFYWAINAGANTAMESSIVWGSPGAMGNAQDLTTGLSAGSSSTNLFEQEQGINLWPDSVAPFFGGDLFTGDAIGIRNLIVTTAVPGATRHIGNLRFEIICLAAL